MFSTTASKLVASAFVVVASASGLSGAAKSPALQDQRAEVPVTLDSTSLLVATLADGEVQTHWIPTATCEHVASAVASGESVAGVRADGVRVFVAKANCSTRRIEGQPTPLAMASSQNR
jgi:hypothetical protein